MWPMILLMSRLPGGHVCGPATGIARLPTVDSLLVGSTRQLMSTERSDRRLGRSATRVKGRK